ncbi:MAG TPA: aspartate-semialdehyde dehydrogenase [Verrucomicrobia bacterium]|nr:aspartate-semialdehyde dehydrogenase [Verrucomicrobiota bacterium]HCG19747.1 aspartate-semialdehyde dehydrogenase [Verrucomicrobiota bacterium]
MKQYNVGLVGVGAVGTEMIKVLKERHFPCGRVQVFASRERDEQILGETYHVRKADEDSFNGLDIVLFAGKTDVAIRLKDAVVKAGAKMIDNSRAFRQDPDVPLVVPQVNPEDLDWNKGVIANPNCTTAIMLEAVAPLHKAKGLKRLIASTYQAASGAGAPGLEELELQMRETVEGKPLTVKAFQHPLVCNLIPHIDKFDETNWYTLEELKMRNEARKMLHAPELMVSCTSVRVPIPRAHSESLNLEFEEKITPGEARAILEKCEGVKVVDDPLHGGYPMPLEATGKYDVLAGRIRQDISRTDGKGLDMFVSGDQLLRGAALNAVEIAEHLVKRGLV